MSTEVPRQPDAWSSMSRTEKVGWTLILLGGISGTAGFLTGNPIPLIAAFPLIGLGLVVKEVGRFNRLYGRSRFASTQPEPPSVITS